MSKSKIVGIMALIAFAMGILLVGDAVAGEYVKWRDVWYSTKMEQINVGDEKDHVILLWEASGTTCNLEGKTFLDGWLINGAGTFDINPKTGAIGKGYNTYTDKDGDKIYLIFEMKGFGGPCTFLKGTGKFEGIQGKGTWFITYTADPKRIYGDCEMEVELPR